MTQLATANGCLLVASCDLLSGWFPYSAPNEARPLRCQFLDRIHHPKQSYFVRSMLHLRNDVIDAAAAVPGMCLSLDAACRILNLLRLA